jgi:hypothetical protein
MSLFQQSNKHNVWISVRNIHNCFESEHQQKLKKNLELPLLQKDSMEGLNHYKIENLFQKTYFKIFLPCYTQ